MIGHCPLQALCLSDARAQGFTEEQIPGWFTREAKPHKAKEGDLPPGQATQIDLPTPKGAPPGLKTPSEGQDPPDEIPEEGEINVPIEQEDSDTPPGSPGYRSAPGGPDLAPSGLSEEQVAFLRGVGVIQQADSGG
jgi:hypothetical protein